MMGAETDRSRALCPLAQPTVPVAAVERAEARLLNAGRARSGGRGEGSGPRRRRFESSGRRGLSPGSHRVGCGEQGLVGRVEAGMLSVARAAVRGEEEDGGEAQRP